MRGLLRPPAPRGPGDTGLVITRRLGAWWLLALGVAAALAFVATDHFWRATATLSFTLLLASVLRIVLPTESAGGLIVRRTFVDVAWLVLLAVMVGVLGFSLDLTAPR